MFATLSSMYTDKVSAVSAFDTPRLTSVLTLNGQSSTICNNENEDVTATWLSDAIESFNDPSSAGYNPGFAASLVGVYANPSTHYFTVLQYDLPGGQKVVTFLSLKKTIVSNFTFDTVNTGGSDPYQKTGMVVKWDPSYWGELQGYNGFSLYINQTPSGCKKVAVNHGGDFSYSSGGILSDTSSPYIYVPFLEKTMYAGALTSVKYSIFFTTMPFVEPSGYEGEDIPDGTSIDSDEDGLNLIQELQQGTSDGKFDTDGDGLSDKVESATYNPYYNEMFCKQTSPYTCADPNPLEKDLFIEIDWMDNGVDPAFKPTSTQLGMVETMLGNKGINVYFDTGEYGGGNELPIYSSEINWEETDGELDIHDFKYGANTTKTGLVSALAPQFDSTYRQGVWRYVLYGVELIADNPTDGGISEPSLDDALIASENDDFYDAFSPVYGNDRARAGVLGHEIGHLLCLTGEQAFPELDSSCVYSAIDTNSESNYKSIMNYDYALPSVYQLSTIDYSDGTHGTGDHDDWGAILGGGMGAFRYNDQYDDAISRALPERAFNFNSKKKGKDSVKIIKSDAEKRARKNFKILEFQPSHE